MVNFAYNFGKENNVIENKLLGYDHLQRLNLRN